MARVSDLLAAGRTFSFEFFPPKTDGAQLSLGHTIAELEPLAPSFVSVTYGAGGSTRARPTRSSPGSGGRPRSRRWPTSPARATPASRDRRDPVDGYRAAGVENILALGGDPPGDPADTAPSDYRYASDLIDDIASRATSRSASPPIPRSTRAHPTGRPTAGTSPPSWPRADFAITQFFFEADHYFRLVDELAALGVDKPVLPGIMPVTNAGQVRRMAEISGAEVPDWLVTRLDGRRRPGRGPPHRRRRGQRAVRRAARAGARPGLHFYTLNRSTATREIYTNLGLGRVAAEQAGRGRVTQAATRRCEWNPPRRQLSRVPYLPGLDGMRALAVVAVMVYHANHTWLSGGFLGVEVFFVISGYLITLLLIGEHERTGRVGLREFWLRRARRLLPALFTMMSRSPSTWRCSSASRKAGLRGDFLAGVFYGQLVPDLRRPGIHGDEAFAPLRHLWSLAVEEQFYLIWPLVMVGIYALGRNRLPRGGPVALRLVRRITVVMAHCCPAGGDRDVRGRRLTAYWRCSVVASASNDTLYLVTFEPGAGGCCSAPRSRWCGGRWPCCAARCATRAGSSTLGACSGSSRSAAGVATCRIVTDDGASTHGCSEAGSSSSGVATLMVIAAVTHRRAVAGPLLGNPVLHWVGTRSYGMYLYHWPIYQIIRGQAGT